MTATAGTVLPKHQNDIFIKIKKIYAIKKLNKKEQKQTCKQIM